MTKRQRLVILALLFLVVLACTDDADPKDPTVQHVLTSNALVYYDILDQFGLFNPLDGPPRIVEIEESGGHTLSFSGMWPVDDELMDEESLGIQVYEMIPNGCGNEMTAGRLLGQTDWISSKGEWEIEDVQIPDDVHFFSSVLVVNEKKFSGFGNSYIWKKGSTSFGSALGGIKMKDAGSNQLKVDVDKQTAVAVGNAEVNGQGIVGTCYNVWRDGQRLIEFEVGADGSWSTALDIKAGDNAFEFKLSNPGTRQVTEINIVGTVEEKLVWPLGHFDEQGKYVPDPSEGKINAWAGGNDYHIQVYGTHTGIDIGSTGDRTLHAVASGSIFKTGRGNCEGNYVVIDHGSWASLYLHLEKIAEGIKPGTNVKTGTVIGTMGSSGTCATGVHLHLGAFRWPNIQNKDSSYIVPCSNCYLNLNPQESDGTSLDACFSPADYWGGLDWSKVKQTGNSFDICTSHHYDCRCLE